MIVKEPDESFKLRSSLLSHPLPRTITNRPSVTWLTRSSGRGRSSTPKPESSRRQHPRDHARTIRPARGLSGVRHPGSATGIMNRAEARLPASASASASLSSTGFYSAGQNLVSQGRLSPYVGLWVGNALLGVLGIVLLVLRERSEGLQLSLLMPARLQRNLTALRRRRDRESELRRDVVGASAQSVARRTQRPTRGSRIVAGSSHRPGQSKQEEARPSLRAIVSGKRQEALESELPGGPTRLSRRTSRAAGCRVGPF